MNAAGPTIRETRDELATLRESIRRERIDLFELTVEARTEDAAREDGVHDDPTPSGLAYAEYNVQAADRALTTALLALTELIDDGTGDA